MLPDVKTKLRDIMQRKRLADSVKSEIDHLNLISMDTPAVREKSEELDGLVKDLMRRISELEDFGVLLRDIDSGLIDFPAKRFGEKVFLCWKYGESDVEFWHGSKEGFSSRKNLRIHAISP